MIITHPSGSLLHADSHDSATPAAALVLASVKDGQAITVVDDMATSSSITVTGATLASPAASLSITLDNATANADTDIGGDLSIQNVTALTLTSNGNASSSTEASAENAVNIDGDFTSITILGDTTVDTTMKIDGAGTAETTARSVTVDASGMTSTARLELDTDSNSYVTYTVTGTANNDTIVAGGTITGGAGNDNLTGLNTKADTIDAGEGTDTVVVTGGADTITLGAGNDTIDLNVTDVTAVAGVDTITISGVWAAGDTATLTIAGVSATYTATAADVVGNAAADLIAIEDSLVNFVNSTFTGVTAANGANATLTLTYDTDVDATVVASEAVSTAGNGDLALAETTAGTDAVAVATEVTDFAAGDKIDIAEFLGAGNAKIGAAISYFEGDHDDIDTGTAGSDNVLVLTDTSYANAAAAQADYDTEMAAADTDLIVVFLNSTTGVAELVYDNDIKGTASTDLETLMTFSNITTLSDLAAAFSDATFVS